MRKPSIGIEVLLWIAVFAAIALTGKYLHTEPQGPQTGSKTVRIGYVSWAEGIAMTYLAQVILEERLDYEVELTMADPAPIFTSLADGNMDFFLDAWLPVTHQRHMDKYGDDLVDLGKNYQDARIGLVVPRYMELESIADLDAKKQLVDGDITGIDSGAGIMEATRKAIQAYDLGMNLLTSSGAAMTAALKDAVQDQTPIVVTGWKPHWMFARWKLKFLMDPKKVYGEAENIHTVARPGIMEDFPELSEFFQNFFFTDKQIGTLMDAMNRHQSQRMAARKWMDEHQELVDSWLP